MSPRIPAGIRPTRAVLFAAALVTATGMAVGACRSRATTSGTTAPAEPPRPAPASAATGQGLTFDKDVAPIVYNNCITCHRQGQAVPFTFTTFADVKKHADKIEDALKAREMPPWLPQPGYGDFVGSRRLAEADVTTFVNWIESGMAEGNAADLPKMPTFKEGWQLGTPDLIVKLPQPYIRHPSTEDVFRNVVFHLALPETKYIRAMEFMPGPQALIHHAVISIDRTRASRRRDGQDGEVGYDGMITQGAQTPDGHFLGWTPGHGPIVSPDGMPWTLEAGSDLVVQLHLLETKKTTPVQPMIGLYFSDKPPVYHPVMLKLSSKSIDIPAGDADYPITDSYVLPVAVQVLSIYPHAHFLGKTMQAYAVLPDGKTLWLLRIDQWSVHWQMDYRYKTPVALPAGTTLHMRYTYDNSSANDDNPRKPPVRVWYGPDSTNEMGDLWLQVLAGSDADRAALERDFSTREAQQNVAGGEMAVHRDPDNADNQLYLGGSYAEVGHMADALPHLEDALRLNPKLASAHNYLAGVLLQQGHVDDAIDQFRQAATLAPLDERMFFNLGNALNAAGRATDAAEEFRKAIAINPEFGEAHDNLGVYLLSQNQPAAAVAELQRAVALAPDNPSAENDLGAALVNAGQSADGIAHIRRALVINPNYAPAEQNLRLLGQRP